MFLEHQGPRRRDLAPPWDVPDKNVVQGASFCCFRGGMARISREFGSGRPDMWVLTRKMVPKSIKMPKKIIFLRSRFRTRSTTTRDRNLQFRGAVSTGGSPLDFLLFLQFLCAI